MTYFTQCVNPITNKPDCALFVRADNWFGWNKKNIEQWVKDTESSARMSGQRIIVFDNEKDMLAFMLRWAS